MSVCNSTYKTTLWGGLILYKFYDRVAKIVSKQPRKTKSSPLPFHKFSWVEKKLAFCQCQLVFICNFARAVQTAVQQKLAVLLLFCSQYRVIKFVNFLPKWPLNCCDFCKVIRAARFLYSDFDQPKKGGKLF